MATNTSRNECLEAAVQQALVGVLLNEQPAAVALHESDDLTKADVERIVRRVLKSELEDAVVKCLSKELKAQKFEDAVTKITANALATYHEILFTRKSTWQSQLKRR